MDGAVAAGLARNPWQSVRKVAATLAELSAEVVDALAVDEAAEVREAVACRGDLSREIVRRMWAGALPGSRVRELLSKNECVQAGWIVEWAGEMRVYELRNVLSRDSEGKGELMEAVAHDGGVEARKLIADLVSMSDECARILSGDVSWEVRRALAGNVSAPLLVLEALAGDADARVSQSAEVSLAYVRSVSEHDGDDAALYRLKAERSARDAAEAHMDAQRERVSRDLRETLREVQERVMQARFGADRERADRFESNYSEIPNSYPHRGVARGWTCSHDGGAHAEPSDKPIVFMSEGEMVEAASRPVLSDRGQNSLAVFGGERVHMALLRRDDLCESAQRALVVHGGERACRVLAGRGVLSDDVQVALAVHGGASVMRVLAERGSLCARARRLVQYR